MLYHAVLIGHQTALKAIRAALWMKQSLGFPSTGQFTPSSPYDRSYHMVMRMPEISYQGRIVGDQEKGLYTLGLWADNRDLLEKTRCFYLVDPQAAPVPIRKPNERTALSLPSMEVLGRFYGWLNEALLTPLRDEWVGKLWEEGSKTPAWSPLVDAVRSLGSAAWVVKTDESEWEEIVKQVLREE